MRAIANILSGGALLILATGASAQEWVPTKPVWDQASRVTCKETSRYVCIRAKQCKAITGHANFKIDFSRNRVVLADGSGWDIKGRAFKIYPRSAPTNPVMSLLLEDGRLFKFIYKPKGPNGPYDLEARMLGHESLVSEIEVSEIEVLEFTCSKS